MIMYCWIFLKGFIWALHPVLRYKRAHGCKIAFKYTPPDEKNVEPVGDSVNNFSPDNEKYRLILQRRQS